MAGRIKIDVTRARVSEQVGKGWALMLNTSGDKWEAVEIGGRKYWTERADLVAALRALRIRVDRHGWVSMIITT
jgi:hypothetical protein